jgi:hypothetical protein
MKLLSLQFQSGELFIRHFFFGGTDVGVEYRLHNQFQPATAGAAATISLDQKVGGVRKTQHSHLRPRLTNALIAKRAVS